MKRLLCLVLLVVAAFAQDSIPEKQKVLWQKLESTVDTVDRDLDGTMGVAILDLNSGQKFLLHADDVFAQASSIKITVLLELYRQAQQGKLRLTDLSALLRRTLQRIRTASEEFHLVLHTSPNSLHRSESLGYWKTIDEDYHWHIEILPILGGKARSYTFKEVYYSPLTSETAVKRLREAKVDG